MTIDYVCYEGQLEIEYKPVNSDELRIGTAITLCKDDGSHHDVVCFCCEVGFYPQGIFGNVDVTMDRIVSALFLYLS